MRIANITAALLCLSMMTTGCAEALPRVVAGPTREIRDTHAAKRSTVIVGIVGAAAALTSAGFVVASSIEDSSIKDGGLATGRDIADAADRGQTYNKIAFASGAAAAMALGATLALYFYGWPSSSRASAEAKPSPPSALRSLVERGALTF